MNIELIQSRLKKFAEDRDWEQFHSPKNITMALSVEVAELVEIFQWSNSGGLDEINDPDIKVQIEKEIADIFNYLLKLTDMLNIDLEKAALNKIEENDAKYPVEKFKGISKKYSDI
jgi:NTP pyrophosphatase (non-canonical NTP hydrolase)|tara:strand:+ start:314 stop:661 length:348 start_codon:yes stop_codon:yes gene_type:complete